MISIVLLIIAAVLHGLAAAGIPSRIGLSEAAWCFFTLAVAFAWGGGALLR